jgi:hypothetical protein
MTLRRVGLSNSLSSQAKISNRRFTLSRVSLRRFPFPTAAAAAAVVNYIEEVFSTWLYTGTAATQTINNGLDLASKGGMVWGKSRSAATDPWVYDSLRGTEKPLATNNTNPQADNGGAALGVTAFNSTGFTLGATDVGSRWNATGATYLTWAFRRQEKFFDIVTYTGDGVTSGRAISHNLGATPGFIIVKRTNGTAAWECWHRSLNSGSGDGYIRLNSTNQGVDSAVSVFGSASAYIAPTATNFTVGSLINASGGTYVAYLFAHNAGGFGLTGTDNVVSCGGYTTTTTASQDINLGFEPQWVLISRSNGANAVSGWFLFDNMREMSFTDNRYVFANSPDAETNIGGAWIRPTPTGFTVTSALAGGGTANYQFIYIAIRRGPMKTPTSGTSVFSPNLWTGSPGTSVTTNFPVDMQINARRDSSNHYTANRLVGVLTTSSTVATGSPVLFTNLTQAENSSANFTNNWSNIGYFQPSYGNSGVNNYVSYSFRRAPGFFDVVCYTGGAAVTTVAHNLSVEPELIITKRRNAAYDWIVYSKTLGTSKLLFLNLTDAQTTFTCFANVTSSSFQASVPANDGTQVAYLFATCPGVSKVGSFTNTGSTINVECGFTSGARFILLKRTSTTGGWFVYDTARGINPDTDPGLALNSSAAEYQITDDIDTYAGGFTFNGANWTQADYIFLAIA